MGHLSFFFLVEMEEWLGRESKVEGAGKDWEERRNCGQV